MQVKAMLEDFICGMVQSPKRKDLLKEAAKYFTRPAEVLDDVIKKKLDITEPSPYVQVPEDFFTF